jgi:hypothetical protein
MVNAARAAVVAAVLLALPTVVSAAGRRPPQNAFQVRFGGFFPSGGGPLWSDVEDRFTLDAGDFDGEVFGVSYVSSLTNSWELGVHLDFFGETVLSAEQDFVDEDGFAIYHDTEFDQTPLTLDIRYLFGGRYRIRPGGVRVLKPVVYVGASAGVDFWDYEEFGDFVDDSNPADPFVYSDHFSEDGEAFQYGVLAGVELPVEPYFHVVFEGRYTWADDNLESDLAFLRSIELGGASAFFGLSFRF